MLSWHSEAGGHLSIAKPPSPVDSWSIRGPRRLDEMQKGEHIPGWLISPGVTLRAGVTECTVSQHPEHCSLADWAAFDMQNVSQR